MSPSLPVPLWRPSLAGRSIRLSCLSPSSSPARVWLSRGFVLNPPHPFSLTGFHAKSNKLATKTRPCRAIPARRRPERRESVQAGRTDARARKDTPDGLVRSGTPCQRTAGVCHDASPAGDSATAPLSPEPGQIRSMLGIDKVRVVDITCRRVRLIRIRCLPLPNSNSVTIRLSTLGPINRTCPGFSL